MEKKQEGIWTKRGVPFHTWYTLNHNPHDLCPPPMSEADFEKFLLRYLEKDFLTTLSLSDAQTRTELLWTILYHYSPEFREEWEDTRRRRRQGDKPKLERKLNIFTYKLKRKANGAFKKFQGKE